MKIQAIEVARTGGPEVLSLEERELGDPGPGQVRIRVRASGVNYIDVYFRTGTYPRPVPFTAETIFTLSTDQSPYFIKVPASYDASHNTATTLFVWMHGCGGDAQGDADTISPGGDRSYIAAGAYLTGTLGTGRDCSVNAYTVATVYHIHSATDANRRPATSGRSAAFLHTDSRALRSSGIVGVLVCWCYDSGRRTRTAPGMRSRRPGRAATAG